MTKKDIDTVCWWIPFRKLRDAVRSLLEAHFFVMKNEVSAVRDEVSAVRDEVSAVRGEVSAVRGEVSAVRGEVSAVRNEICTNVQKIINTNSNFYPHADLKQDKQKLIDKNIPFMSTIVSVYNLGEKYLVACFESIINQTLKNIEIIIVNDCSPLEEDDRICREYASKDSRIKYILHDKNMGGGAARMTGLKEAKGYSIHFMDGDDYLALHAYEVVFSQMIDKNIDIITFGYYNMFEESIENYDFNITGVDFKVPYLMYGDDIFNAFCMGNIEPQLWNKFYKHDFLKSLGYNLMLDKNRADDLSYNIKLFYHAKSLINMPVNLYYYRIRENSQDTNISKNYIYDIANVIKNAIDYFKDNFYKVEINNIFILFFRNYGYTLNQIRKYFYNKDNTYYEYERLLFSTMLQTLEYMGDIINLDDMCILIKDLYNYDIEYIQLFCNYIVIPKKYIEYQSDKANMDIEKMLYSSSNILFTYKTDKSSPYRTYKAIFTKNVYNYNDQLPSSIDLLCPHGLVTFSPNTEIMEYSYKNNINTLLSEDAFLRSVTTWANRNVDILYLTVVAYTFSNLPHFYAYGITTIEYMLNNKSLIISDEQIQRAKYLIRKIIDNKISKYNHQPIYKLEIGDKSRKKVLVVDQSFGDMSIKYGGASEQTFKDMLAAAVKENQDSDIIIKTHPDALVSNSPRQLCYYFQDDVTADNIYLFTDEINPISMLEVVDKVYVCSSQFGFEALMCGKEVHVFGMPFYAGWGLTHDRQVCDRRTNKRSLEEMFYIAYIMYSYYVNPDKECRCEIEDAIDWLLKGREQYFKEYGVRNELN